MTYKQFTGWKLLLLDRIKDRFKDPLEIEISEGAEKLRERNAEELAQVQEEYESHREEMREKVGELKDALVKLEDFEDSKDRAVVNDVVENIVSKRLNDLDDLEFSDKAEEFKADIEEFLQDFEHMKRKEAAVMKAVPENLKLNEIVSELRGQKKKLDSFVQEKYSLKTNIEKLKDLDSEREELIERIEEIENEMQELDVEGLEEKLHEKREELDNLNESSEWKDYQNLKQELEEAKKNLAKLENQEGKAINKMERGLKKLIYRIDETDLEYGGNLKLLKKIRDGKKDEINQYPASEIKSTVKEALESLPEGLLSDSQETKFIEAVQSLGNIEEMRENIKKQEAEIEEIRERLDSHKVLEKKDELKKEIESAEKKLRDERNNLENLKSVLEEKRKHLEETERELKEKMREVSSRELVFESDEGDRD